MRAPGPLKTTPHEQRAPRTRLENERVAEETLTQKEARGMATVVGALQEKAVSGPVWPNVDTEG